MASYTVLRCSSVAKKIRFSLRRIVCNAVITRHSFHTSLIFNGSKGIPINMPALSPTMTEGTIVKWLKKEGDPINPGDALCDIQTDKAVMSMEIEEQGVLAKIVMPDDSKDIKIGTLIAVMVEEGADWKDVEMPGGAAVAAAPQVTLDTPAAPSATPQVISSSGPGMPIKMPSLSPTMTEGTIVKWLKKEGDTFAPGDVLCDIQTDKAVMSLEVEESGILAKIIMPDDSKDVKIGTVIALMVEEGEDWKVVQTSSPQMAASVPSAGPPATPSPAAPQAASAPGVYSGPGIALKMPSLSPTMTEGTIVNWMKKEGDVVNPGDVLCEIQTDKAVMSMECDETGILAKIVMPGDSKDVKIGTLIGVMVEEGEDWKAVQATSISPVAVAAPTAAAPTAAAPAAAPAAAKQPSKHAPAAIDGSMGPAVRILLQQYGLSPKDVKASGPRNQLLKGDVLKHIESNQLKPVEQKPVAAPKISAAAPSAAPGTKAPAKGAPASEYIDIPHTTMRKTIAKRLLESKTTIPHAYAAIDCVIDGVLTLRAELKAQGRKVSVNDFVIKAAALALQRIPAVNVQWVEDAPKFIPQIDISVAVATEAGLITPIVKNPASLRVDDISSAVRELAAKARVGKLAPHEFMGGSFTISNLGMFGITQFSAIINPPQSAILAIGTGRATLTEELVPRTRMLATLSYDARPIDEDSAAQFLQSFRDFMENPGLLMTGIPESRMGITV